MRIEPSIARNLWYFPPLDGGRHEDGQPFAAILAGINDDGTVNLGVFARDGSPYGVQNVRLVQDGEAFDPEAEHAVWMPYQKGQAARTEQIAQSIDLTPVLGRLGDLEVSSASRFEAIETRISSFELPPMVSLTMADTAQQEAGHALAESAGENGAAPAEASQAAPEAGQQAGA